MCHGPHRLWTAASRALLLAAEGWGGRLEGGKFKSGLLPQFWPAAARSLFTVMLAVVLRMGRVCGLDVVRIVFNLATVCIQP